MTRRLAAFTLLALACEPKTGPTTRPPHGGAGGAGDPIVDEVQAGGGHTCVRRRSGKVACWGSGSAGQLGNGAFEDTATPVEVAGVTDAIALALGKRHTCALRKTGQVACWGWNGEGQLGDGSGGPKQPTLATAVQVRGLDDAVKLSAGDDHTCAVRRSGALVCWGGNRWRQLGNDTRAVFVTPVAVSGVTNVIAVAAGEGHTCALRSQGDALCWGRSDAAQLGGAAGRGGATPRVVAGTAGSVDITAGKNHTCVRDRRGAVRCWGANAAGQATGTPGVAVVQPTAVPVPGAAEISAGDAHTCARMSDGTVRCWGLAAEGRLGQTVDASAKPGPRLVPDLAGTAQVAVGANHACARKSTGKLWCWGRNDGGALGAGRLGPSSQPGNPVVAGLADAVQVEAGVDFACARREDGGVLCWGRNDAGQLGGGSRKAHSAEPVTPLGVASTIDIAVGDRHACAVTRRGEVMCWGAGEAGQLGGGTANRNRPASVPSVKDAVEVEAGVEHTCVRLRSGTATCWGGQTNVQVGAPVGSVRPPPTPVKTLVSVKRLAGGALHSCAIEGAGSVKCWGANGAGQLGNGAGAKGLVPQAIPVAVHGVTDAADVVAGAKHTCVRRGTGQVVCFGDSTKSQLGAGVSGFWSTRVPVKGLTDATAIDARNDVTCVLVAGSGVRCWGTAAEGFFSAGTTQPHPVAVSAPSGLKSIALGGAHICGVRTDSKVECWGDNGFGQRGDGALAFLDSATPVAGL